MNTPTQWFLPALVLAVTALPVLAAPKPALTPQQAKAAAVKKIPGRATSAKYEFEEGRWQYAVLVTTKAGGMYEVEVNPTTGQVMDTEKTSAADEAKEAAADKKAAMKGKSAK